MRFASPFRHFAAVSLPLAVVIVLLFALFGSESAILETLRAHKNAQYALRQVMFFFTDYSNFLMYAVYLALAMWAHKKKVPGVWRMVLGFAVIQFLVCFGVVNLAKVALGRPRPEAESIFWDLWSFSPLYHSLPSGHTAEIFGAVMPLVLVFRRWPVTIALGMLAALVGFSRIYLHMHYPTDVVFGWLFGSYAGWASFAYIEHVHRTHRPTAGAPAPQTIFGLHLHE